MTVSPTIRIVALVALVAVLGACAFVFLELGHHAKTTPPPALAAHRHATATATAGHASAAHRTTTAHHTAARASATAGLARAEQFPARLTHLLRFHSVVVAVLYAPGVASETGVVALGRAGAKQVHAGFIALDVRDERTAEMLSLRFPDAFDPAVLILNRQGEAVTLLNGTPQSAAVAQAVLDARR